MWIDEKNTKQYKSNKRVDEDLVFVKFGNNKTIDTTFSQQCRDVKL